MQRVSYASDLSECRVGPAGAAAGTRIDWPPADRNVREIVNGIFYVLRTGCQWRYLPADYGPWSTVSHHFYRWRDDGTWARVLDVLRRAERVRQGRHPKPSGLLLDSQSVKTTEKGGRAATTRASGSVAASGIC